MPHYKHLSLGHSVNTHCWAVKQYMFSQRVTIFITPKKSVSRYVTLICILILENKSRRATERRAHGEGGVYLFEPFTIALLRNRMKECRHRLSVWATCAFRPPLAFTDPWLQEKKKKLRAVQGVKSYLLRTGITSRPHVWYKLPPCICFVFFVRSFPRNYVQLFHP